VPSRGASDIGRSPAITKQVVGTPPLHGSGAMTGTNIGLACAEAAGTSPAATHAADAARMVRRSTTAAASVLGVCIWDYSLLGFLLCAPIAWRLTWKKSGIRPIIGSASRFPTSGISRDGYDSAEYIYPTTPSMEFTIAIRATHLRRASSLEAGAAPFDCLTDGAGGASGSSGGASASAAGGAALAALARRGGVVASGGGAAGTAGGAKGASSSSPSANSSTGAAGSGASAAGGGSGGGSGASAAGSGTTRPPDALTARISVVTAFDTESGDGVTWGESNPAS